jgi:DNA-nicking Smr family endonuclease
MEDFGKILEKWDSKGATGADDRKESEMGDWLDRYPPQEKDSDTGPPTAAKRRNPEKMKVEGTLDLHGFKLDEAIAATDRFIDESVESGLRKVMVVHGKGENGQGVLRREIRAHLERHPLTGRMGYGRGSEGGRGALWVILRERKEPEQESGD